jgi:hypothetical protein
MAGEGLVIGETDVIARHRRQQKTSPLMNLRADLR